MDIRETSYLNSYNVKTYNKIREILKDNDRCAVVQPTGTGKSYIMMKLLYDYKDKWKIVIAPSKDFLDTLEHNKYWTSEKTLPLTYAFLGINYNNIDLALADFKINKDDVGLIVIDELHRAAAPKWGAGVNNLIKLCKNAKTLGLTATPKRFDKGVDMVEELFDNNIACNMTLYEAIEMGILPKLNYVVGMHDININLNELIDKIPNDIEHEYVRDKIEQYRSKWDFTNYFTNTISKYIDTSEKSGKHLVFASSIEEANGMGVVVERWFRKLFADSSVRVFIIHSKREDASEQIEEFFRDNEYNEVKVAIAVNMLSESFHCEDIKTISMFRGTKSVQVYMQQIGRALTANGGAPHIFDFVDNYHSIDEIKEVLVPSKEYSNSNISNIMFAEFVDEARWFGIDLNNLKKLTDETRLDAFVDIANKISKSKDGTIYTLDDIKYIRWADYILKNYTVRIFNNVDKDIKEQVLNKIDLSLDISTHLGFDWYMTWLDIINNNENIDRLKSKKIRSKFNKMVILNKLKTSTLEFFKGHGLETSITDNKEKLLYLLENNTPKSFKYMDKFIKLEENLQGADSYKTFRDLRTINKAVEPGEIKRFAYDMVGDACVYWLLRIYHQEYKDKIQEICTKYNELKEFENFFMHSKRYSFDLPSYSINYVDKYFSDKGSLNELDNHILYILNHFKIKNIDRVYQIIFKELWMTEALDSIEAKLDYAIENDNISDKLVKYIDTVINRSTEKMELNHLVWSDRVTEEYNHLINIRDTINRYVNNDLISDDTWLIEYIKNNKENIDKNKKKSLRFRGKNPQKIVNTLNYFNSYNIFEENIDENFITEFRNKVIESENRWNSVLGYKPRYKALIGFMALSEIDMYNEDIKVSPISYRLSDSINTIFEWLKYCEYYTNYTTSDMHQIALELSDMIKLIGNKSVYLFNSAMSKRNKSYYMIAYNEYMSNRRKSISNRFNIISNLTDRDTQLFYDVKNCKLIDNYTNINKFNNLLLEAYDKH